MCCVACRHVVCVVWRVWCGVRSVFLVCGAWCVSGVSSRVVCEVSETLPSLCPSCPSPGWPGTAQAKDSQARAGAEKHGEESHSMRCPVMRPYDTNQPRACDRAAMQMHDVSC